jgi:cation diffusion facilitator CzcD-associated flavoprotein CzcO
VAVVGAGFGGIAAGVTLQRAGLKNFSIFESSDRIGGTWWDNQYPGCEVDVPTHMYSFPFKRWDWKRSHAKQAELHSYLESTASDWDLWPHFRLGVSIDRAVWNEDTHRYKLSLDNGETYECHVLICATGFLNLPKYPDWPGLDKFKGPKFHTSRWEHEHDLADKVVAVVGTGSTAGQIIPEIAPIVKKLYVFQREPGWVRPKGDRAFSAEERAKLRNPVRYWARRAQGLWMLEVMCWRGRTYTPGSAVNDAARAQCLAFIDAEFADRPDLRAALTPTYPYPGKRPIFNSTFYAALKRNNVELIPRAVTSVTPCGVVDTDAVERPVDVLVMATGFQPTRYLARIEITGVDGRTLHECWDGEPRAFLGSTVPNFPNLFILYGPGTNGGEIVSLLLRQSEHAVRSIRRLLREQTTAVEVDPLWADLYHTWLQGMMRGKSWTMSRNYFTTESGKVVTQWPFGAMPYRLMSRILSRPSENTRPQLTREDETLARTKSAAVQDTSEDIEDTSEDYDLVLNSRVSPVPQRADADQKRISAIDR